MSPEDAIKHAMDGNAILFTGAGFSWGAKNIKDEHIPAGRQLAKDLLASIGYSPSDVALDKASAAYLRRMSAQDMINFLVPLFTVKSVSPAHREIASLPFRRVYTTNYDWVFEEARRSAGLEFHSVQGVDAPRLHGFKKNLIVHINGSISNIDEEKLGKSFKLVSESYAADSFMDSGWAFQFRSDVRTARAIIFIGYSMYDLDIRRAMFSEDVSDRCLFVTAPLTSANELDAEDLADLGVLAPVGVDAFAQMVAQTKLDYVPQEPELLFEAWEAISEPVAIAQRPTDEEVLNFLTAGDVSEALANEISSPNHEQYSISRTIASAIEGDVSRGEMPVVVIGDLGVGKTVLCETVSRALLRSGYDVYRLNNATGTELEELRDLCELPGKKLLVIENYQRHKDLIRWISESKPQDVSCIFTARTSAHDLSQRDLLQLFPLGVKLYDISQLDVPEVASAVHIFDQYGLWQARAAWSSERKFSFVVTECSSSLPSLLVDILKSQHITEKYKDLLRNVSNRLDVEALLICVFSLEAASFSVELSHVQELLEDSVNWAAMRAQNELRSIVSFESRAIRPKSSVLAMHLLHEVFTAPQVVRVLIRMVKSADARRTSDEYYRILNALMRYGHVSVMLSDQSRLESTINFYEGIKNLDSTRRNPQFWLQYAIGCLALNRLERSERYFNTAYSFTRPGYDTFQIDNHFARLLFEKSLLEVNVDDAKLIFDRGMAIVLQQMNEEIKFYPYRVALGVFRFYDKFKTSFTPLHKKSLIRSFMEIEKRAGATAGRLRSNKYVEECLTRSRVALAELR